MSDTEVQYCRVPKNVLPKNGQAAIFRFLGTCLAGKLKIRTVWIIVRKTCTLCCIEGHHLFVDKSVNRLESRKLRTAPGYDTGPHVLRHPTVLYSPFSIQTVDIEIQVYNRHMSITVCKGQTCLLTRQADCIVLTCITCRA